MLLLSTYGSFTKELNSRLRRSSVGKVGDVPRHEWSGTDSHYDLQICRGSWEVSRP